MRYLLLSILLVSCAHKPSYTRSEYYRRDITTLGVKCPNNYYYSVSGMCIPMGYQYSGVVEMGETDVKVRR
jgi:hypothetical protein